MDKTKALSVGYETIYNDEDTGLEWMTNFNSSHQVQKGKEGYLIVFDRDEKMISITYINKEIIGALTSLLKED